MRSKTEVYAYESAYMTALSDAMAIDTEATYVLDGQVHRYHVGHNARRQCGHIRDGSVITKTNHSFNSSTAL